MKILERTISEKTENIINGLTSSFSKKTEYFDITKTTLKGFGAVYHDNPEMYEVYIDTALEGDNFETNVICELLHIKEAEKGFPACGLKNSEVILQEKNIAFFQYLNHSLGSAILDINVFDQLIGMGLDISFFTEYKFELLKKADPNTNFSDKYNRASFAIQFILFVLTASEDSVKEAIEFVNGLYNGMANVLMPMVNTIKDIGYDTPKQCAQVMCYIADSFKLWDAIYVQLGEDKIRTSGTYRKYFGIE